MSNEMNVVTMISIVGTRYPPDLTLIPTSTTSTSSSTSSTSSTSSSSSTTTTTEAPR
ncbi:unnamed protein product, partial [Adineta ricciae]